MTAIVTMFRSNCKRLQVRARPRVRSQVTRLSLPKSSCSFWIYSSLRKEIKLRRLLKFKFTIMRTCYAVHTRDVIKTSIQSAFGPSETEVNID